MARIIARAAVVVALASPACARNETPRAWGRADRPGRERASGPTRDSAADSRRPAVLFLGTSLTAGLGVESDQAYPALIQRRLDSLGIAWRVVNAGESGETSAGARRRIGWLLQGPIRILVVETGANDGLRGLDVDSTRANLEAIIRAARTHDSTIAIVLAGMQVPPNLGPQYALHFRLLFGDLARRGHLGLIPFLLAGVGGVDSLNQADGIHPNPAGHRIVAENVWRVLEPLIRGADAPARAGAEGAR